MKSRQVIKLSKFLSLVLRHRPEQIGLSLDSHGWADVAELMTKAKQAGVELTPESLKTVVAQNNKKRFIFNEDGTKIRANQGHSISVDLDLKAIQPPDFLYHGTAARFLESIKAEGLLPQGRHHVHLSADEKSAILVGKRHGQPVVLVIKAREMGQVGYQFYRSENGVWLTEHVPVDYIGFST